jgi:DNA transformation protein and related proteins
MAVSREWEDFVLEQLSGLGRVRAKRMFGGLGLYLDETFFGLVIGTGGDVYFKVDDDNRPAYEAAGSGPFRPFAEKAYAMSFWRVPADVLDDPDEMASWARDAVAAARRSAVAKAKRKTGAGKPRGKKPAAASAAPRPTPRTPRPKRG